MAIAIMSFSSCEEDGPLSSVTSIHDLNGVWKATSVNGASPTGLDYIAVVDGARWGMLFEGKTWRNSISTRMAGDGSNKIFFNNNGTAITMYLRKFTGSTMEIEYNGEIRKYWLDKNAATAIISNQKITGGSRRFVVYEKDKNGKIMYKIDLGALSTTHFRGPVCLYTTTLYADIYDYNWNYIETTYWSNLKAGINWTLTYK